MINVAKPHPTKSDEKHLCDKSQVKTAKMPGSVQSHFNGHLIWTYGKV